LLLCLPGEFADLPRIGPCWPIGLHSRRPRREPLLSEASRDYEPDRGFHARIRSVGSPFPSVMAYPPSEAVIFLLLAAVAVVRIAQGAPASGEVGELEGVVAVDPT